MGLDIPTDLRIIEIDDMPDDKLLMWASPESYVLVENIGQLTGEQGGRLMETTMVVCAKCGKESEFIANGSIECMPDGEFVDGTNWVCASCAGMNDGGC